MKTKFIKWVGMTLAIGVLLTAPVLAQNPTGTVSGTVTDADGGALPGVTVTAESDNLQGERSTVTGGNGSYKFAFLPAGEYTLSFELDGFNTSVSTVKVSAAQSRVADATMQIAGVSEEVTVTSTTTISESQTVSSTYTADEIEKLAVARNINQAVQLAPGVHATGPSNNITIQGAMSFENLWLVNGVVINENLRGQALDLFIEDAIQETTTSTAGISAEYGRFTGGVVNVLTKSGGNEFSGSLRASLTNDDWETDTPLTVAGSKEDKINEVFEATFGGAIVKDKLWFFLAGRDRETNTTEQTALTSIPYGRDSLQDRTEAKLTASLTPSHNLIGSYLEINQSTSGGSPSFADILDLASLSTRQDPQEIQSINYTGILTPSFFVQGQYSERDYGIGNGSGGPRDLYAGSLFETTFDSSSWNAPWFCGECEDEVRNNENLLASASYFLSSDDGGTHDITFGVDTFNDIRFAVNHQSGSDFRLAVDDFFIGPNNEVFPIVAGGQNDNAWVAAWPVFGLDNARATDFTTNSFYVNDSWQLNDKWSFNIGARYDENDGQDAGGATVASDSKISPRLGLNYDVKGDGDLLINASIGTYVAAVANSRANATATGGALGRAILFYDGQPINPDGDACVARGDCVSSEDASRIFVDWWLGASGFNPITDRPELIANIPGVQFLIVPGTESNRKIPGTIKSPAATEFTVGMTKRLGSKGLFRADVVFREWEDFYADATSPNNQVPVEGTLQDLVSIGNFDAGLERDYIGLNTQARYRINDRLTLAGTYTWSQLEGNINGETAGSGPVSSAPNSYSEYKEARWNTPVGPLSADQEHKLRAWAVYDILDNERQSLSVSLLQSFFSGSPYSASDNYDTRPYVTNPGYTSPPSTSTYFFSPRGAFKTDDITRTDVALNYSFHFGDKFEVFIQPEVLNLLDESGVVDPDNGIRVLDAFNPFTETPSEGTNWEKRDNFGQPVNEEDFQIPRTFRVSVGFRF